MTFVTYYTGLLSAGSIGGYIALGLLAVALLIMLVSAILAFGRGTSRAMMRLLTVGAAAVLAFFVTRIIGRAFLVNAPVGDYFLLIPEDLMRPLAQENFSLVALPVLFVGLFLFFSLVFILVHKLFCGILGFSYARNNIFTRLFAIVIGLLQGAFIAIVIALPIFNVCSIYADAAKESDASDAVVSIYEDYMKATGESPVFDLAMNNGGRLLLSAFEAATTDALPKE